MSLQSPLYAVLDPTADVVQQDAQVGFHSMSTGFCRKGLEPVVTGGLPLRWIVYGRKDSNAAEVVIRSPDFALSHPAFH